MSEHTNSRMDRESMEYDVLIVGGGPSGLATAIKLKQLAESNGKEISVCLLEKGAEIGNHILSGAIIEPRALDELIPNWKEEAPLNTRVSKDEIYVFLNDKKSIKIPNFFVPKTMHNPKSNYIASLGNLCRWLGERAEVLGVEIYTGFAASEVLYNEDGSVKGVATPDIGINRAGNKKESFEPGMELHAKYTVFAEGCRGQLGKEVIAKFNLDAESDPQHYGIGIKEIWQIPEKKHQQGLVVHAAGWPLDVVKTSSAGGSFMYHLEDNQVAIGLVVGLDYQNPYLSPFEEFQRMKLHPVFAQYLQGGNRISYGARALIKGGYNALPKMTMPGALLVGCDAGTLNFAKIKGTHTAMKSGMVAAEILYEKLTISGVGGEELHQFHQLFLQSWAGKELYSSRNFGSAMHKFGAILGSAFNFIDQMFGGKLPITLREKKYDHHSLQLAVDSEKIHYPKPDGKLTFDRLSSVNLSNTYHEENIFCHLTLKDKNTPIVTNLELYDAPEQRYCPAGVYEIIEEDGKPKLQINSQNCVHCKTCDIKDPTQNIVWIAPEAGGGPSYTSM